MPNKKQSKNSIDNEQKNIIKEEVKKCIEEEKRGNIMPPVNTIVIIRDEKFNIPNILYQHFLNDLTNFKYKWLTVKTEDDIKKFKPPIDEI